jgi:hypothetical protein
MSRPVVRVTDGGAPRRARILQVIRAMSQSANSVVPALVGLLASGELGPQARQDVLDTVSAIDPNVKADIPRDGRPQRQ